MYKCRDEEAELGEDHGGDEDHAESGDVGKDGHRAAHPAGQHRGGEYRPEPGHHYSLCGGYAMIVGDPDAKLAFARAARGVK